MAIVQAPPHRPEPALPAARDAGIDVVRALCVVIVVLLHAVMVGVTVGPTGPVFANAAEGAAWFAPLTWLVQIMPLFFVIGGFAGLLAFRRLRARGGSAASFVAGRVQRLLLPAVVVVAAAGAGLAALSVAGVPAEFVQIAGFRFSQPLWFLAVFLLCQTLLPALAAAHERAPVRSLVALVTAAVAVDAVRASSGIDAVGLLNLAFVWLALQQVGFFLADGRIDALRRRTRVLAGIGAITLLAAAAAIGAYSFDLFANLNPPTTALLLLGVAQTALVSLVRPRLTRISVRPRVAAFTGFVTSRAMTIYLWHMPVLLTMAGVSALFAMDTGLRLPEPSSGAWWLTRPLWFAAAIALTAGAAWLLAGAEHRRMPQPPASVRLVCQAALLGLAGVALLLAVGTSVLTAVIAVALLVLALARLRAEPTPSTGRSGSGAVRRDRAGRQRS